MKVRLLCFDQNSLCVTHSNNHSHPHIHHFLNVFHQFSLANELSDNDSDEIDYDEVPIEEFDELSDNEMEENLEQAVRNISEKTFFGGEFFLWVGFFWLIMTILIHF